MANQGQARFLWYPHYRLVFIQSFSQTFLPKIPPFPVPRQSTKSDEQPIYFLRSTELSLITRFQPCGEASNVYFMTPLILPTLFSQHDPFDEQQTDLILLLQ